MIYQLKLTYDKRKITDIFEHSLKVQNVKNRLDRWSIIQGLISSTMNMAVLPAIKV